MNPKTILFVDDDQQLLDALARRSRQMGLNVETARNTLTAISILEKHRLDLVCIDVNMPTGNGLRMCELIGEDLRARAVPLIVLTGRSDAETISQCEQLQARYVQKGTDAWQAIQPVIQETLQLSIPDETHQDGEEKTVPTPDLVEAVFATLGANASWLEKASVDPIDATSDTRRWSESPPWVLLIEDDQHFSLAMKLRLERNGVAVVRAFEGQQGVTDAVSRPADAIILDFNLPNGQGDYVLRRLKASPQTKDIPVIVVTGVKDQSLQQKMLSLGAASFFTKPIDFERLHEELKRHINILPVTD